MVASTRNGVVNEENSIEALRAAIEDMNRNMLTAQTQMNERISSLYLQHQHFQTELQKFKSGEGNSHKQVTRFTKLEFPKFDGTDVKGWIYRSKQFFLADQVEDDDKVRIASIHMQGRALNWHQQFVRLNGEDVEWALYETAIQKRFGSSIDDPLSELKKLKQTGTVEEYHDKFEYLLNKVEISEKHAVSLFLGGLRKDIELSVRMFKPKSLEDAYSLAKLQEDMTSFTVKKPILSHQPKTSYQQWPRTLHTTSNQLALANTPYNNTSEQKTLATNSVTRRRLTQKEMEEKRAKGQCFYCDQKYAPGHKCPGQLYSLEVVVDEEVEHQLLSEMSDIEEEEEHEFAADQGINSPHISLNALTGTNAYQTMRVKGLVNKYKIHILIDSGSTHNFLDINVAKKLGCKISGTPPLSVFVPGGNQTLSANQCHNFQWQLNGETFKSDVMLLQIGSCDMVLGIQWLGTLGDIMWNFEKLKMTFLYKGKKVELRGQQSSASIVDGKKISKIVQQPQVQLNAMCLCIYPVTLCSMEVNQSNKQQGTNTVHKGIQNLIATYSDVFEVPRSLPPKRSCDHRILLKEGSQPVNIRPYRHPPSQKDAIEVMVKELLKSGVIRPSQSPFSSPIVMVKKKDGSWRMCVDYRELNARTIKDRFPIPIIEELIDELSGSKVFTKLDLRAGYHQIRMYDEDIAKTAFRTHDGHYEFLVMPFGLTNAPSTFQSLMNDVFRPFLRKFTLVFFDDILVYSPNLETHIHHLQQVLEVMKQNTNTSIDSMSQFVLYQSHSMSLYIYGFES
ncbi:uncharacterized protein [Rutidosis leptorrhynchoides]|uniref:uncharacterized protein n=1 Tax=Rutidosis leptorrhynchoides TaxID=125765 RepID=UPI003A992492